MELATSNDPHGWRYGTLRGYAIAEMLGKGGFGTVYRATQLSTGQSVAVKVLRVDSGASESVTQRQRSRFHRETQLLARLRHPHIVALLDTLETDLGELCAVFEFVPGETLTDILGRRRTLQPSQVKTIMAQVLDALSCAHREGIVHRDIKPQNVMVMGTGSQPNVKLVDFGIGTFTRVAGTDQASLTHAGEILCTPAYAAPEQLRGEPATPQSDLYAWGLVFLECLLGSPVLRSGTLAELLYQQLSPSDFLLPAGIAAHPIGPLLSRVLRKDLRGRARSAASVFEELANIRVDDLVGTFEPNPASITPREALTQETVENWEGGLPAVRRVGVTAMSWSLGVVAVADGTDQEVLEAFTRDQLNLGRDTVAKFGGYSAGSLGQRVLSFFGYPEQRDSAARAAALAALELEADVRRRSAGLQANGLRLELRVGLHAGTILVSGNELPIGQTPDTAMRLEALAQPGELLASEAIVHLLKGHMLFEATQTKAGQAAGEAHRLLGERPGGFAIVPHRYVFNSILGRDRELELLSDGWERARGGATVALLLKGPSGIGKTRLLYEFWRTTAANSRATFDGRCMPEHRNVALYPLLELLRDHLGLSESKSADEAASRVTSALERAGADTAEVPGVVCEWLAISNRVGAAQGQHSPQKQRELLFTALESLLFAEGPTFFALEDLHWADPTTLEFLSYVLSSRRSAGALLALTARHEFTAPWDEKDVSSLELSVLSDELSQQLITRASNGRPLADDVVRFVLERGDGVPLFVEELTQNLFERVLREEDGLYRLPADFDATSVPISLQGSLAERLERLGPAAETARVAAAIGREFSHDVLVAASARSSDAVSVDVELLIQCELLLTRRHVEGRLYSFRHALLRDVAYESMPRSVRRAVHRRIASVLEGDALNLPRALPAELARHYAEADDFETAVAHGTKAATVSLQRFALQEALVQARQTMHWLTRLRTPSRASQELEVNGLFAQTLMAMRGWADPEVRTAVDRSMSLLQELADGDDPSLVLPTLYHAFLYHHVASNRSECRQLAERFETFAASHDRSSQAAGATLRGLALHADGDFIAAAEALQRSLDLYDPKADDQAGRFGLDSFVWASATLGLVRWFSHGPDAAMTCTDQALERARTIGHIPSLGIALLYKAIVHQYSRDRDGARRATEELLGLSAKYGLPAFEGYGAVIHGWAIGSPDTARHILKVLSGMGCRLALHYYGALPAETDAEQDRPEAALTQLDECLALCHRNDDRALEPELHRWRANYLYRSTPSRLSEACEALEQAIALGRTRGLERTATLAEEALLIWRKNAPTIALAAPDDSTLAGQVTLQSLE
jgi:TOMM system kinase/cyclase fusion protein